MDNGHFIQAIATYSAGLEKRIAQLDKTIEELQKGLNAVNAALAVQRDLMEELEQRLVEVEARPTMEEEPDVEEELLMDDDDTEESEQETAEVAAEEPASVAEPVEETSVETVEEPQDEPAPQIEEKEEPVAAEPVQENPKPKPAPVPAEPARTEAPKANTAYGQPVSDLKQAISIGDRFLYQRELFGKNGELMQRTIADLNGLSSFDEAMAYIDKHFNWDKELPSYELFVNALHRRFA